MAELSGSDSASGDTSDHRFTQATQALVESSNQALRQSRQQLSQLEAERSALEARVQALTDTLTRERDHRIATEARLQAHVSMARRRPPLLLITLSAMTGGLLGGVIAGLALQLGRPAAVRPTELSTSSVTSPAPASEAQKPASAVSAGGDTLRLRCDQPCWIDVREMGSKRVLVSRNLRGTLTLPLNTGLDVFTGRGDLLMIQINNNPETRFSTGTVVRRLVLPPEA